MPVILYKARSENCVMTKNKNGILSLSQKREVLCWQCLNFVGTIMWKDYRSKDLVCSFLATDRGRLHQDRMHMYMYFHIISMICRQNGIMMAMVWHVTGAIPHLFRERIIATTGQQPLVAMEIINWLLSWDVDIVTLEVIIPAEQETICIKHPWLGVVYQHDYLYCR